MKVGLVIGIAMLYIIVLGLQMVALGVDDITDANNLGRLLDGYNPDTMENEGVYPGALETHTNAETGRSEAAFNAGDFVRIAKTVGGMSMLYSPVLFQGSYLWFWFVVCFPISIAFWLVLGLAIFRGVGSS